MSVNIKNTETVRLVRELVAATGESVTDAVTVAVRERLDRVRAHPDEASRTRAARLRALARDAGPRWEEPHKSARHGEVLYDDRGMPR